MQCASSNQAERQGVDELFAITREGESCCPIERAIHAARGRTKKAEHDSSASYTECNRP